MLVSNTDDIISNITSKWTNYLFSSYKNINYKSLCLSMHDDHAGESLCVRFPLTDQPFRAGVPPLPLRPPMLVILLVARVGYLFLHQPQLIVEVVVDFHELLDLSFRGRESVFHLHVFLHRNGTIRQVRVKALLEWRGKKKQKTVVTAVNLIIESFYLWT